MSIRDVLSVSRNLEQSGMERPQAEEVARALRDATEDLATKADLEREITSVKVKISSVESEVAFVKSEVAFVKSDVAFVKSEVASVKSQMATKADLASRIYELEARLLWRLTIVMSSLAGLAIAFERMLG